MRVVWCGLEFNGDEGDATYSIEPNGLTGIFDGAGTRGDSAPRPNADGNFSSPGYRSALSGSIAGLVEAGSPYEYERAIQDLKALPVRDVSELTVMSAAGVVRCDARRVGSVSVKPLVYGRSARYMVEWSSPDAFWTGDTATFVGSSVQLFQRGDVESHPTIEVAGPRGAYSITGPRGEVFQVTQSLSSGQRHLLEMATARVYRDGVLQPGVVASAGTWSVSPGPAVSASISSGVMTVRLPDRFAG